MCVCVCVCRVFVIAGNGNYGCLVPEYIENKLAATARQKRQKTLANWHRYRDIESAIHHPYQSQQCSHFPVPSSPARSRSTLNLKCKIKVNQFQLQKHSHRTFFFFFRERLRSPVVEESTYSTLSQPINQITAFCLLSLWFWLCAYATKTKLQEDSPSWYCNFVQKSLTEIQRIYHKYAHINHHTSNKFWIILHTLYRLYSHSLSHTL